MKGSTVMLQPSQRLTGVHKEWHTRKQRGKDVAYIVSDRLGEYALITQKLPLLTQFINERADHKGARISTTALYVGADRSKESRDGAYIKGRWKLQTVMDLKEATKEFERARKENVHSVIVGEPACYVVCA